MPTDGPRIGDAPNFSTFRRTAWSVIALLASGCSLVLPLDGQTDGPAVADGTAMDGVAHDERPMGEAVLLEQGVGDAVAEAPVQEGGGPDGAPTTCLDMCSKGWCNLGSGVNKDILDLAGPDLNNLWAVGAGGTVLRFAPDTSKCTWKPVSVPTSVLLASTNVTAVWVSSPTTVHLGTKTGTLLLLNKGQWSTPPAMSGMPAAINDIVADGAGSVIAVGDNGKLLKFVNQATPFWDALASGTTQHLLAAVPTGTGSFVVGGTGSTLFSVSLSGGVADHACNDSASVFRGVWTDGSELVAVGETSGLGVIVSITGTCSLQSATTVLNAVAGYNKTELYLVGNGGVALLYNNGTPKSIPGLSVDLNAVWVNPDTNAKMLIVAGQNGQIWGRKLP